MNKYLDLYMSVNDSEPLKICSNPITEACNALSIWLEYCVVFRRFITAFSSSLFIDVTIDEDYNFVSRVSFADKVVYVRFFGVIDFHVL